MAEQNSELWFKFIGDEPIPVPAWEPGVLDLRDTCRRSGKAEQTLRAFHAVTTELSVGGMTDAVAVQTLLFGWRSDPIKVIIRRERWWDIKEDADLAAFLAECHVKKIDPWSDEAYPILEYDFRQKRTRCIAAARINTVLALAESSGVFAGLDATVFDYSDSAIPDAATVTVYKMVDGQRVPFTAVALYRNYYPGGGKDSLWDRNPEVCIETIALSMALRRAFPRQLNRVYIGAELARRPQGPNTGARDDQPSRDDEPVEQVPTAASAPNNLAELHRAMADIGMKVLTDRDKLVRKMRVAHPGLEQANPRRFYVKVLDQAMAVVGMADEATA